MRDDEMMQICSKEEAEVDWRFMYFVNLLEVKATTWKRKKKE